MTVVVEQVERPRQYDDWLTPRWRVIGRTLVLLWLAVLLTASLGAEKESSLHHLEAGLREGSVSAVEVTNLPGPDSTGLSLVTLRWQGRFVDRFAQVAVVQGARHRSTQPWAQGLPRFRGPALVERLRDLEPQVRLTYRDHHDTSRWTLMSWEVPAWLALAGAVAWILSFGLATGGPEPWRATRWAWFWLILLGGWVGVTAFLLLGGPLGVGRPRDAGRRLTGGWAFLLALFIGSPSGPQT